MSRVVLEELTSFLDEAFGRPRGPLGESQSLLGNLATVRDDMWDIVPAGATRSIREIALHVGWAKYMYDDYAFRNGTLQGGSGPAYPEDRATMTPEELIAWATQGHRRLMASVGALHDEDLPLERNTNWGGRMATRDILRVMLEHDIYHAGEINHLRSLLVERDAWAWELDPPDPLP